MPAFSVSSGLAGNMGSNLPSLPFPPGMNEHWEEHESNGFGTDRIFAINRKSVLAIIGLISGGPIFFWQPVTSRLLSYVLNYLVLKLRKYRAYTNIVPQIKYADYFYSAAQSEWDDAMSGPSGWDGSVTLLWTFLCPSVGWLVCLTVGMLQFPIRAGNKTSMLPFGALLHISLLPFFLSIYLYILSVRIRINDFPTFTFVLLAFVLVWGLGWSSLSACVYSWQQKHITVTYFKVVKYVHNIKLWIRLSICVHSCQLMHCHQNVFTVINSL